MSRTTVPEHLNDESFLIDPNWHRDLDAQLAKGPALSVAKL